MQLIISIVIFFLGIYGMILLAQKDCNTNHQTENNLRSSPSPMEIIIKPEALDLSGLESCNEGLSSFRPKTFNQYIGQDKGKNRIKTYINGSKKYGDQMPHIFLSAPAGCGKTIFANIIANLLEKKFICCTGGDIKSEQQLVDKIAECKGGVLFIDEAHRISKKIGTFLLPILEEGKVLGQKIKPFIMILATTHKGNLSESLSALVQRFLPIELEPYTQENLIKIFQQYISKQYPEESLPMDVLREIANSCRQTPRIGLAYLKEYVYLKDWKKVKLNNGIVKDGLTERDINLLKYINEVGGAGKNTLAKFLRVEPKTYEFEIEPYLISKGLISIGSKRYITEVGKLIINNERGG